MKTRYLTLLVTVLLLAGLSGYAGTKWKNPYIGEWSNGRGESLVITGSTIKFGDDKPVNYHDITRVTDEKEFNLQITSEREINYLAKFLHVSLSDPDNSGEMKIILYNSRKDLAAGENSQGETTWYRTSESRRAQQN